MATSPLSRMAQSFTSPALRRITLEVQKVNGVNLGQGVCQLPTPDFIIEAAHDAAKEGINRYTNPRGLPSLRNALAKKFAHYNKFEADPETEILVASGATGAFEGVCATLLDPGDEVVVFEPSYPYHVQCLRRYGANIRFIKLEAPDWTIDFDELKSVVNEKTKFILANTPGNPTGKVFSKEEFLEIGKIIEPFSKCFLVTDEIYEYMVFDGLSHVSAASLPELKGKVITVGGYSKTFSITGWRIGYVVAPKEIADPMTTAMDAIYVCPPAPLQEGVARGIEEFGDKFYNDLTEKYRHHRNLFTKGLADIGLTPLVPAGAYYMLCGYDKLMPELGSYEFVTKMIATCGVGAVPADDFVRDPSKAKWVRFCLAVPEETLQEALERMKKLALVTA